MKCFALIVLLGIHGLASCGHSLQSVAVAFRVDSNVLDATVWIDDILVGQASEWQRPGRYIRPGFHRIELRHPNYYSVFQEIEPAAGTQIQVQAHLQPLIQ